METNLAPIVMETMLVSASPKATKKNFLNEFFNSIIKHDLFIYKWHFGNIVAFMDLYIFKGNNFFITGK